jgi:hypothetical protein
MKKKIFICLFLSQISFAQRGTPVDGVDYVSDPWSTGNIILWVIIIAVLGYSGLKSLAKSEAEKELRDKQNKDREL